MNDHYEADGIGLISVNNRYFTKSGVLSNFYDKLLSKDQLKDTLNRYVSITITDMTDLIPEFMYYIHWAAYIEQYMQKGYSFCKPDICTTIETAHNRPEQDGEAVKLVQYVNRSCDRTMKARGLYNIKLVAMPSDERGEIVVNDLDFDEMHRVYILTGANRGGKTTITQAIGQLYVLAQGGIHVPARSFAFSPIDMIFTHFPADEDKTMDLGRLGEECKRFREMYRNATKNSLLLHNESFSTTSFEEGYYIARDVVKAILHKGIRTIYNTHMHKLAFDIDEINQADTDGKASSLTVATEGGRRSYKVELGALSGKSYADDIAKKYGVTYEMLTEEVF